MWLQALSCAQRKKFWGETLYIRKLYWAENMYVSCIYLVRVRVPGTIARKWSLERKRCKSDEMAKSPSDVSLEALHTIRR